MSEEQSKDAKAVESPASPAAAASPATAHAELAHTMRMVGYGSLAFGCLQLGTSVLALTRGLRVAAVSPLVPGVLVLLFAVLLFNAATALEGIAALSDEQERGRKTLDTLNKLFLDKGRYITLTLALGAVWFLVVGFR